MIETTKDRWSGGMWIRKIRLFLHRVFLDLRSWSTCRRDVLHWEARLISGREQNHAEFAAGLGNKGGRTNYRVFRPCRLQFVVGISTTTLSD